MARILVVLENDESRNRLVRALDTHGHFVETKENINSALQTLRARCFDLIVIKSDSAVLETRLLCRDVRESSPLSGIMVLSNNSDIEYVESALDSGVDDYLRCDVDLRELTARVNALARRYSYVSNLLPVPYTMNDLSFDQPGTLLLN
jgi:DNA-binding response OmpR family regulator